MIKKEINLALIGAGGIGKVWANAVKKTKNVQLKAVADTNSKKAEELSNSFKDCSFHSSAAPIFKDKIINGIVVATPHKWLASLSLAGLKSGKHILCEKPAGISSKEIRKNIQEAKKRKLVYMVGFNHRYHPGFLMARKIIKQAGIGKLMFIRARYGFGGRKNYQTEWRFQKRVSGGGELLDQGVHMIDLSRFFLGDFRDIHGFAEDFFWPGRVEDNGFLLLRTKNRKVASIHVSWTNWDWIHSFEIFGSRGYLIINGLDQRYHGPEKLIWGRQDPKFQKFPEEKIYIFENENKEDSFQRELKDFILAIRGENKNIPTGEDAYEVLKIVEKVYKYK